jgi:hypothetical protein
MLHTNLDVNEYGHLTFAGHDTVDLANTYGTPLMVLDEDTAFVRGKICQMSKPKRYKYLDEHMMVWNYYFRNNEHLSQLISVCIDRFFAAVDNGEEPKPFIETDSQQNIIESIRQNVLYNDDAVLELDLSSYDYARHEADAASERKRAELQKIIDIAKEYNVCRFRATDGTTASFAKNGRFLMKSPEATL